MISQAAEYALRAVLCLAARGASGAPALTTQQVAERTGIPPGYLAKIMQGLAKSGILSSQRGIGGGFSLSISPDELSLLTIVRAVDTGSRVCSCCEQAPEMPGVSNLHRRLEDAAAEADRMLGTVTVAQVLAGHADPVCSTG